MPSNIERSFFRRAGYVGYGRQGVYRIFGRSGEWRVVAPNGRGATLSTLQDVSEWVREN